MKFWNTQFILCRSLFAAALLTAGLAMRADENQTKPTAGSDKDKSAHIKNAPTDTASVIRDAAQMNMLVMRLADVASQKAQNSELKQYAQTLRQDHERAQSELRPIAQKHNVTLPTTLDEKCQQEVSELQAKSGEEFDREFAKGAVEGHAMAIAHLQHASSNVQDSDVRQYTEKMMSKVKEHQRQARQVARTVGIDQATIASLESQAREGVGSPAAGGQRGTSSSQNPSGQNSNRPGQIPNTSDNSTGKQ